MRRRKASEGMSLWCGALPNNFVPELIGTEDCIHNKLQIMARGGVAVQIETGRWLQHTTKLYQPDGHHSEIGHHIVIA